MKNKIITFLLAVAPPLLCPAQALFTSDGLLIGTRSKLGTATVNIKVPQGMLMRYKAIDASGDTDQKHFSIFFPPYYSSDLDKDFVEVDGSIDYGLGGNLNLIKL